MMLKTLLLTLVLSTNPVDDTPQAIATSLVNSLVELIAALSQNAPRLEKRDRAPFFDQEFLMQTRTFKIPFRATGHEIDHVSLYWSMDRGKTWHFADKIPASQGYFRVSVLEEGLYWFGSRALLKDGSILHGDESIQPELQVRVDTRKAK